MKNQSGINEKELERLTKIILESEHDKEELDEILTGTKVGDFIQGVKGIYQGEGYYYFKYLSKIKNRSAKVIREMDDIKNFVNELLELKTKIEKIKNIAPQKKIRLLNLIDTVSKLWLPFEPPFNKAVREMFNTSNEKLKGERLDVIPGTKKNVVGTDLMQSQETSKTEDDLNKPEEIPVNFDKETKKAERRINTTSDVTNQSGFEAQKKEDKPIQEEISRFKQLIKQ
jgi:hypothetical protein